MNSRFFNLCRVYSNSLSNVGEIRLRLFMSSIKRENRHFHVVVVHGKEMDKKNVAPADLFFC